MDIVGIKIGKEDGKKTEWIICITAGDLGQNMKHAKVKGKQWISWPFKD